MDKKVNQWLESEQKKAFDYLYSQDFKFSESQNIYYKKITFNSRKIDLKVLIPNEYPLKYPKFYIDDKSWHLTYPHIEEYKTSIGSSICYLEDEDKVPVMDGATIIKNELTRILSIIDEYHNNTFQKDDFLLEFDSYWSDEIIYLDLYNQLQEAQILKISNVKKFGRVISTNIDNTINNFTVLNHEITKTEDILFLPFSNYISYPLPTTYSKIMNIIRELGYEDFLRTNINKYKMSKVVLFSFFIGKEIHFGTFTLHSIKNVVPKLLPDYDIKKGRVKRIDRERIFTRGGNNLTRDISMNEITVGVIGCGSLGGSLAFKLAKSGVKNFILIDKDFLDIGNIARHICGMKYFKLSKVEAIKMLILEHFPDCNIEISNQDAIDSLELIDKANLIVSAIGSEGNIFEHFFSQLNDRPKIFTWFEADIAGQIIFTKSKIEDFNKLTSKIRVTKEEYISSLSKNDIGCNSMFTPYSFIDAENTVNHVARFITNFISKKGNLKEEVWTIFGDNELNKDKIEVEYQDSPAFSIKKRPLLGLTDD